jgi:aminopeptidase N
MLTTRTAFGILMLISSVCYGQSVSYESIAAAEAEAAQKRTYSLPAGLQNLYSAYDVLHYHLDVALENDTSLISGRVDMLFRVMGSTMDTLAVELIQQMQVDSIKVNGISRPFAHSGDTLMVFFNPGALAGSTMTLSTWYHGTPPASGFFSGLSSAWFPLWQSHVTWTLSEPWLGKQWWPVKQDLQDKADSVSVYITTSNVNKAGSIGLLKAVVPVPGNKVRYEWRSRYPIDYYLVSCAVGPYQDYSIYAKPAGMTDSILIQNYIFDVPGCLQQYKANIDKTPAYLALFSDLFSLYPFHAEKYGHCLAYLGGAMEHQTMTTTGDFAPDLISHELAHQWFGDNVTCATWNDIWINEGFATYGTYLARQYTEGQASADVFMQGIHDVVMSAPDGSVYIPDSEVDNVFRIFDGRLSYNKGAAILHMLRFEMDDDTLFFNTLKDFQQQYGGSTASGLDFKAVAESTSGLDFDDFFDQWYFGEGYPTFYINYLNSGDSLLLRIAQSPSTAVTPLFRMSLALKLHNATSDTTIRLHLDQAIQDFKLPFMHEVTGITVDPEGWCLLKVGGIQEGITEMGKRLSFQISPNPASDRILIEFEGNAPAMREIELTDLSGRSLEKVFTEKSRLELSLGGLKNGMYFISVRQDAQRSCRKIIKY